MPRRSTTGRPVSCVSLKGMFQRKSKDARSYALPEHLLTGGNRCPRPAIKRTDAAVPAAADAPGASAAPGSSALGHVLVLGLLLVLVALVASGLASSGISKPPRSRYLDLDLLLT